jgi:hypothetical protein
MIYTTPESIEAMFLYRNEDQIRSLLGSLNVIVIDELHAFLEGTRGLHLSSLLSRIEDYRQRLFERSPCPQHFRIFPMQVPGCRRGSAFESLRAGPAVLRFGYLSAAVQTLTARMALPSISWWMKSSQT